MNLKKYILAIFIIVVSVVLWTNINFPVTTQEAKESYTSYAIAKTGYDVDGKSASIYPSADGEYLSTVAVYIRLPLVIIFGLNSFSIRIASLVFCLLSIITFRRIVLTIFKKSFKTTLLILLFVISPYFLYISVTELSKSASMFFVLLSFLFLINRRNKPAIAASVLAVFSSFETLPFLFISVLYFDSMNKKYKYLMLKFICMSVVLYASFIKVPQLSQYIKNHSILIKLTPSSYTYLIDKKLNFGQSLNSPLIVKNVNFNRIVHNKILYTFNELLKLPINLIDFELLSSPFQSATILDEENINTVRLPLIYFWEWFLILPGMYFLYKNESPSSLRSEYLLPSLRRKKNPSEAKNSSLSSMGIRPRSFAKGDKHNIFPIIVGTLTCIVVFPFSFPTMLSILFIFAEVEFLSFVFEKLRFRYLAVGVVGILWFISLASFLDIFYLHPRMWMSQFDVIQERIWRYVDRDMTKKYEITLTDRLGNPAYYYLYYHQIDPALFFNSVRRTNFKTSGVNRIEQVGNVKFSSFKFTEVNLNANHIWIGLMGEFIGENKKYTEVTVLNGGKIINEFYDIKIKNKSFGNALWFVKT